MPTAVADKHLSEAHRQTTISEVSFAVHAMTCLNGGSYAMPSCRCTAAAAAARQRCRSATQRCRCPHNALAHLRPSNCSMLAQSQHTTGHTSSEVAADKADAQRVCRRHRSAQSGSIISLAAATTSCVWQTHPSPLPANLPADHGCSGQTQLE